MKKTLIIIFGLISSFGFSQTMTTQFSRTGILKDSPNLISNSVCKFKESKEVTIIEYVNENWWKVKFKDNTGYTVEPFLLMTDEMNELKNAKIVETNYKKYKIDSIEQVKFNEQKRREADSLNLITNIKQNIIKYVNDSLLIVDIVKDAKILSKASILGDVILTTTKQEKGILIDYVKEDYYKICIGNTCGFIRGWSFNYKGAANSKLVKELVKEFKTKRKEEIIRENIESTFKRIEAENERYYNSNECDYTSNEIDEFTRGKRIVTNYYSIDKKRDYTSSIRIRLRRYGNNKHIQIISSSDLGCTSPYSHNLSSVKFKLENGDILTFFHKGDVDCGSFDLLGVLTANDIIRLKKSPIKTIRLTGTEFYKDIEDVYFKDFFIKKINCIN